MSKQNNSIFTAFALTSTLSLSLSLVLLSMAAGVEVCCFALDSHCGCSLLSALYGMSTE
jgi:hypothetical protein